MTYQVLHDEIGKPSATIMGNNGKPAKIFYACCVNGFPTKDVVELRYSHDGQGLIWVELTAQDPNDGTETFGCWSLDAINNRISKGLEGFIEFAKRLEVQGAQLAHILMDNYHEPPAPREKKQED